MLTLQDFDQHISPVIVQRGLDYFENRYVDHLDETSPGHWLASVSGSEDYEVEVVLSGKARVQSVACDCPYDGGPICKHIVAVLYALREQAAAAPKPKRANKTKPLTFEEMLLRVELEDLRAFVRHQQQASRDFSNQFLLYFADKDPNLDVAAKYRNLVRQLVRQHSSHGFMEYRSTFAFSQKLDSILGAGRKAIGQQNYRDALAIGQVLCEALIEVMQTCDDSAGKVSGVLFSSMELFEEIALAKTVSPALLEDLYAYLDAAVRNRRWFDIGDFGLNLLAVAETVALRVEPESFLRLLDELAAAATGKYDNYLRDRLRTTKIRFLKDLGHDEEADALVAESMDIVEVRRGVVEAATQQKDFAKAKQLVAEGIQIAQDQQHPGTVSYWEKVLLDIARAEGDTAEVRRLTKHFAFDGGVNTEYYQAWKSTYSPAEWPSVLEQHLAAVTAEAPRGTRQPASDRLGYTLFRRLYPIYILEEQWERLLHLLPKDPDAQMLAAVHPHLAQRYPQELLALYLPVLDTLAQQAKNRGDYQRLANLMKVLKRDIEGSHAAIQTLTTRLLAIYQHRPAMCEELRQVL